MHQHPFHELVYILRGTYRTEVGGAWHELTEADSALYPAGLRHRPINTADQVLIVVQWDDAFADGATVKAAPRFGADPHGALRQALRWLEAWVIDVSVPDHDRAALLRVILRHHANAGRLVVTDPLVRARHLLESHLFYDLSLEGLAGNIGMSRASLGKRFRDRYGMAPMAYRRQCRLDRAIDLITEGGQSLTEIANQVGFATAAHLSNLLKRERGVRPRDLT